MAFLQNGHSFSLDPSSLILYQLSNNSDQPHLLQLEPQSLPMERGPRYNAYAALRESMLRMKRVKQSVPERNYEEEEEEYGITMTPPKKQVKFQAPPSRRPKGSSSVLAQSVPDFSSAMRKENRKPPPSALPTLMEKSLTPPPPAKPRMLMGKLSDSGSKSVNSSDNKRAAGGMMTRKSYASLEGLRGLASDARSSINAENRGSSRIGRGIGKTILGFSRQY